MTGARWFVLNHTDLIKDNLITYLDKLKIIYPRLFNNGPYLFKCGNLLLSECDFTPTILKHLLQLKIVPTQNKISETISLKDVLIIADLHLGIKSLCYDNLIYPVMGTVERTKVSRNRESDVHMKTNGGKKRKIDNFSRIRPDIKSQTLTFGPYNSTTKSIDMTRSKKVQIRGIADVKNIKKKHYHISSHQPDWGKTYVLTKLVNEFNGSMLNDISNWTGVTPDASFIVIDEMSNKGKQKSFDFSNLKAMTSNGALTTYEGNKKWYGKGYTPRVDCIYFFTSNVSIYKMYAKNINPGTGRCTMSAAEATQLEARMHIIALDYDIDAERAMYVEPDFSMMTEDKFNAYIDSIIQPVMRQFLLRFDSNLLTQEDKDYYAEVLRSPLATHKYHWVIPITSLKHALNEIIYYMIMIYNGLINFRAAGNISIANAYTAVDMFIGSRLLRDKHPSLPGLMTSWTTFLKWIPDIFHKKIDDNALSVPESTKKAFHVADTYITKKLFSNLYDEEAMLRARHAIAAGTKIGMTMPATEMDLDPNNTVQRIDKNYIHRTWHRKMTTSYEKFWQEIHWCISNANTMNKTDITNAICRDVIDKLTYDTGKKPTNTRPNILSTVSNKLLMPTDATALINDDDDDISRLTLELTPPESVYVNTPDGTSYLQRVIGIHGDFFLLTN